MACQDLAVGARQVARGGLRLRVRHEDQAGVVVLADDAARLLALQVVPDDPGLALRFGDLVLVNAKPGLVVSVRRDALGIIVNILSEVPNDGIDLLLRERFERPLRLARSRDEPLDLAGLCCAGLLKTAADCGFRCGAYHGSFLHLECCSTQTWRSLAQSVRGKQ